MNWQRPIQTLSMNQSGQNLSSKDNNGFFKLLMRLLLCNRALIQYVVDGRDTNWLGRCAIDLYNMANLEVINDSLFKSNESYLEERRRLRSCHRPSTLKHLQIWSANFVTCGEDLWRPTQISRSPNRE